MDFGDRAKSMAPGVIITDFLVAIVIDVVASKTLTQIYDFLKSRFPGGYSAPAVEIKPPLDEVSHVGRLKNFTNTF